MIHRKNETASLVDHVYLAVTGKILDSEYAPESVDTACAAMHSAGIKSASFGWGHVSVTIDGATASASGKPWIGTVPSIFNAALDRARTIAAFRCGCKHAARKLASVYYTYADRRTGVYKEARDYVRLLDWQAAGRPADWVDADALNAQEKKR